MDEQDFLKEQFLTLREEIGQRQVRKFKILTAGLFGIPALALAGRYLENQYDSGEVLFAIAPIIILVSCFVYISENNGVMRAGRYIRRVIEPNFNIVGWEQWLENGIDSGTRDVDKYLNASVFLVALLYYIGSLVIFSKYSDPILERYDLNTIVMFIYILLGGVFLYVAFVRARYSTRDLK